jgi:hypothetical protein
MSDNTWGQTAALIKSKDYQPADVNLVPSYREYVTSGGNMSFPDWKNIGAPGDYHAELVMRRNAPGADQNALGPQEHGAWAYSTMRDNPVTGLATNLVTIPAYTLAKYLGLHGGRSQPSLEEMAAGYDGMWRGLMANMQGTRK